MPKPIVRQPLEPQNCNCVEDGRHTLHMVSKDISNLYIVECKMIYNTKGKSIVQERV